MTAGALTTRSIRPYLVTAKRWEHRVATYLGGTQCIRGVKSPDVFLNEYTFEIKTNHSNQAIKCASDTIRAALRKGGGRLGTLGVPHYPYQHQNYWYDVTLLSSFKVSKPSHPSTTFGGHDVSETSPKLDPSVFSMGPLAALIAKAWDQLEDSTAPSYVPRGVVICQAATHVGNQLLVARRRLI